MESTRKCSKCNQEKPCQSFQLRKGKPFGQCRQCKTEYMKEFRKKNGIKEKKFSFIEDGRKMCLSCNTMKPLEEFSPSQRGLGGVAAYCKPCIANKYRNKDKAKIATAKYREANKEKYLEAHRLRQSNRNALKKKMDDGSVSNLFLKEIYSTTSCYYCKKDTDKSDRTIDHKVPLSKSGLHSTKNIVMSCRSCNCSKRSDLPEDFLLKLKGA